MLNTLTNFEILDMLKKYNNFLGCYMSDQLSPLLIQNLVFPSYIIINLDDAKNIFNDNSGTHWVLLIIEKNKLLYIDSYGVYPDKPTLKFCRLICKKYGINELYFNKIQIQDLDTTSCGWWAIYFIQQHSKAVDIPTLLDFHSQNNTMQNEKLLMKYFKK